MTDGLVKKKFIVNTENLPKTSSSAQHIIRFRVISEDRNRVSDWSPIFVLDSSGQIPPFGASAPFVLTSASSNSSTVLDLTWSESFISTFYDIFVKWDTDQFVFYKTVSSNNLKIIAKSNSSSAKFIVQSASYPVLPYSSAASGVVRISTTPLLSSVLKILETGTIVY